MLATYFGGLALILAAIGINGQMAYLVALQRKEIGVRIALGASARRIVAWIVGSGLGIGLAGAAIGLVLAVPAVGALRSLLVDTSPYDVTAFTLAPLLLLAAIAAACLVPALRASTVDPMVELRKD
jgi:ABC-type antimicrobial peptide transport system permease subunit